MRTELVPIQADNREAIDRAAALIAAGELVAFPTETVYGLGGNACDPDAARRIYEAKGRPSDNPLIVHIAERSQLQEAARDIPPQAYRLADAFWPGPLTMILPRNPQIPLATTGGLDTVAVRMPNHPVALELIRCSSCMIAAPSANASGRPSPTEARHVAEDLDGRIPMILDAGPVGIGIESTIIDLTEKELMVLRPGYISLAMLSDVLGCEVVLDPGIVSEDTTRRPKAPGMRYRHYAPKAQMLIVSGREDAVVAEINRRICDSKRLQADALAGDVSRKKETVSNASGILPSSEKIAVIATEETCALYPQADVVLTIGSRSDEEGIARHLYGILRQCDEEGVDIIYSEAFETPHMGQAIMNRMLKAAGHRIIYV